MFCKDCGRQFSPSADETMCEYCYDAMCEYERTGEQEMTTKLRNLTVVEFLAHDPQKLLVLGDGSPQQIADLKINETFATLLITGASAKVLARDGRIWYHTKTSWNIHEAVTLSKMVPKLTDETRLEICGFVEQEVGVKV